MDLNEYQTEALKTAVYPLERALDYTVLGLCSEVAEFLVDPSKSELGDCWWYWAAILDALDTKPSELRPWEGVDYHWFMLLGIVGDLAGATKKAIRDDEGRVTAERRVQLLELLARLRDMLYKAARNYHWSTDGVLVVNLNKLADRKERGVIKGSGDYR